MSKANTTMAAAIALIAGSGMLGGVVYVLIGPAGPSTPTDLKAAAEITLYGSEKGATYTFGTEPGNLTSPGPALRIKADELVRVIFKNVGQLPHAFAVVEAPKDDPKLLFGALIASPAKPLVPGQEGAVTFRASKHGTFTYMCTVPGHWRLGMLGQITVES